MAEIEIVNVAYRYENGDGKQFVLEVNQCLNFTESMIHSILYIYQARHAGLVINDAPKVCDSSSSQDIRTKDKSVIMPLQMNGPIPYSPISKPTLENIDCLPMINLSSDEVEWDPYYIFNGNKSNNYTYLEDDFNVSYTIQGLRILNEVLQQHDEHVPTISLLHSSKVSAERLATLWGFGLNAAECTLKATT